MISVILNLYFGYICVKNDLVAWESANSLVITCRFNIPLIPLISGWEQLT